MDKENRFVVLNVNRIYLYRYEIVIVIADIVGIDEQTSCEKWIFLCSREKKSERIFLVCSSWVVGDGHNIYNISRPLTGAVVYKLYNSLSNRYCSFCD